MKTFAALLIGLLLFTSCASPQVPPRPVIRTSSVLSPKQQAFAATAPQPPVLSIPDPPSNTQWIVLTYPDVSKTFTVYQKNDLIRDPWLVATNVATNSVMFPIDKSIVSRFFKVVPDMPRVTLVWSPSPDTSVVGYDVYYGIASRMYTNKTDVGNSLSQVIALKKGVKYYFAATAYNLIGLESNYSDEATYTAPTDAVYSLPVATSVFPGAPVVTNLAAVNVSSNSATIGGRIIDNGGAVPVTMFLWGTQNPSADTNADWQSITATGTNATTSPVWLTLSNLSPNTTYYYAFSARNASGRGEARPVMSFTTKTTLLAVSRFRSYALPSVPRKLVVPLRSPKWAASGNSFF